MHPTFGHTVSASVAPPPISGGTLLVTHDGVTAVVSDPDRDAVYVVDVAGGAVLATLAMQAGDEPGRLVEDAAGHVHVALRGGGAIATIDPSAGAVTDRQAICPAPRGLAYDPAADVIWAACATGELVSLPAAGGAPTTQFVVERDLRDVVIQDGAIAVSTFRSAELLRLNADGTIARRDRMPATQPHQAPHVAWRAVAGTNGAIVVAHQEESKQSVNAEVPSAYGGIGPSIVGSVVTVIRADGSMQTNDLLFDAVLPVDVALAPDGKHVAVASAGNAFLPGPSVVYFVPGKAPAQVWTPSSSEVIAVAFDGAGDVVVQEREPATLHVVDPATGKKRKSIELSSVSRADSGLDIFHTAAGASIACASCHPEGGDDGHVWLLDGQRRRTPSLRGTIAGTAPYHWTGEEPDIRVLLTDVYTKRMSGVALGADQTAALRRWVEAIPAPPAPSWVDAAAAKRGQAIFERDEVGCAGCHSGAKRTNNGTVDVGTGRAFQVPSLLGVGWRTPLLHDGCAATIADRFGKCATPRHGDTTKLSPANLDDLATYLETL